MSEKRFRVAEVFGPTIQGEGSMQGAVTHFIRFGACDYRCTWCDSMHAVLPQLVKQLPFLTTEEILEQVDALPPSPWITFSGGNPAMWELMPLVDELHAREFMLNVETQGTIWRDWIGEMDCITVSPKPPSAGNTTSMETLGKFLSNLHSWHPYCLKVVVFDDTDYEYAQLVHKTFPEPPMFVQVGNPDPPAEALNWDNAADVSALLDRLQWLSEKVAADPEMGLVRVCPQMHVLIWNNERGR